MRLLLFLMYCSFNLSLGQNLVLNSSFEEYAECPSSISDLDTCIHWSTPNQTTPDYYNSCSNYFSSSIPFNISGKQNSYSGNGYIGIITHTKNTWYSEIAQGKLKKPLEKGQSYEVSFYASAGETSSFYHKLLGAGFSKDSLSNEPFIISALNDSMILRDMNSTAINSPNEWILVSGKYKAIGGEKYILIGNVYGSPNKSEIQINRNNKPKIKEHVSYCYIDDVSVIPLNNEIEEENTKDAISENEIQKGKILILSESSAIFIGNTDKIFTETDLAKNYKIALKETKLNSGAIDTVTTRWEKIQLVKIMLDFLANALVQNPSLKIEIEVYDTYELSERRAKSICCYLEKRGAKRRQMSYKGYEKNKLNSNKIQFKILEI